MPTKITREQLEDRIQHERPQNDSPTGGYALVNVLGKDAFAKEHIPGSVNIPQGNEEAFGRRYDKDKDIVVYCASSSCHASPEVAEALERQGFRNVKHYAAGMSGWKDGGNDVASGPA